MFSCLESIVDTADKCIFGNLITSLDKLVAKRDRLIVVGTDDGFRESAVFFNEKVCHLRTLGDPVVSVEDLILIHFISELFHNLLKAFSSLC